MTNTSFVHNDNQSYIEKKRKYSVQKENYTKCTYLRSIPEITNSVLIRCIEDLLDIIAPEYDLEYFISLSNYCKTIIYKTLVDLKIF